MNKLVVNGIKLKNRDFNGSRVVKAQCFHCKGNRLIPGQEIKIPQDTWDDQKKKKQNHRNRIKLT